jgi:hypothetical protein
MDQLEPEQKLMAAILEDVLRDFHEYVLGHTECEKNRFKEAEDWILAEDSQWLYSFENTCLHLDIDCQCFRRKLMAWKSAVLRDQPCAPEFAPSQESLVQKSESSADTPQVRQRAGKVTQPREGALGSEPVHSRGHH